MALDAATPRALFAGTGAVSAFSCTDQDGNPISYAANAEIKVGIYVTATDVWTVLEEGIDYELAGSKAPEEVTYNNGIVTLVDELGVARNLPAGQTLVIWRETVLDQPTVFGAAGAFSAATHTALADRDRRIDQELEDAITRALKLARHEGYFEALGKRVTDAADPVGAQDLVTKSYGDTNYGGAAAASAAAAATAAANSASAAHTSENNADASEDAVRQMYEQILANYATTTNTTTEARENLVLDSLNAAFDGTEVTFDLTLGGAAVFPRNAASLLVFLNGVYQYPTASYSIADDTITFEGPPGAGDDAVIILMMNALPSQWQGAWVTGTDYAASDLVANGGNVYVATAAHTASAINEPGVGASWADVWDLFVAKGTDGDDGREVALQVSATHIQWQYAGDAGWTDLIALADLQGQDGREVELQTAAATLQWRYVGDVDWTNLYDLSLLDGADGEPGREVELQKSDTYIQWRYVGDTEWTDLVALADITGPGGAGSGDMLAANNLSDLADAAVARANLGLEIGVDVQAHSANLDSWASVAPASFLTTSDAALAYQPIDTDLSAIAALSTTPFGRSLLELANAAAARVTLGVRTTAIDDIAASFDGSVVAFDLKVATAAFTPRDAFGLIVILNGVVQVPGDAYTVAGSTITFAAAPDSGDTCAIWAVST